MNFWQVKKSSLTSESQLYNPKVRRLGNALRFEVNFKNLTTKLFKHSSINKNMNYLIIIIILISFLVTYLITPILIKYLKRIDITVKDQNKEGKPLIPISGGLAVLAGTFAGLLIFIFFRTFIYPISSGLILNDTNLKFLFAGMISLLIITLVGFLDDIIIRKDKESSTGLRQWQKPLFTLIAAIPLMVVSAGTNHMTFPLLGRIEFGILYPLLLVPLGVVGAANMVNMLGGYNGMETGIGIISIGMLGLYAYINNSLMAGLIALTVFSSLIAFYIYNKYPAKILPGDSLTYLLGATMAVIAILGNIEKAALILSIPFFIEFILKSRSKFQAQSYGYFKYGKVKIDTKKIYSLPHILAKTGKYTEKEITHSLILLEIIFGILIWVI